MVHVSGFFYSRAEPLGHTRDHLEKKLCYKTNQPSQTAEEWLWGAASTRRNKGKTLYITDRIMMEHKRIAGRDAEGA